MRIGSAPDLQQRLLFMLSAAQREPALIRRRKQRPWAQEPDALPGLRDPIPAPGEEPRAELGAD